MRSWIPGSRTRRQTPLAASIVVPSTIDTARPAIEEDLGTTAQPWLVQIGRRLLRNTPAMIGLGLVLFVVLVALLAPVIGRYNPNSIPGNFSLTDLNQAPSGAHWFGTDYLGRDLYARVVWGARGSLLAGMGIVLLSFAIGVPLGIIAGYGGRLADDLIARLLDVMLTLPGILLALVLVGFLGPGLESVVIALGIAGIPGYARVARGSTLSAKHALFVESSRAQGAGAAHIMFRHIFPNIVDPIVILGTLNLSGGILAAAAFSFIGVGTQVPASDWGTLLAQGYQHMFQSGAEIYFPGLAILITVLGINLLGDGLGDALNPRLRGR
jgi:ABC-type dipeptide/oligopeptide/nickel transport system permease subunit